MNFLVFIDYLAAILFHVSESYTITAPGNCAHSMPAEQLKNPVEVRMPKYPECWETCGNCASGEVVIQTLLVRPGDEIGRGNRAEQVAHEPGPHQRPSAHVGHLRHGPGGPAPATREPSPFFHVRIRLADLANSPDMFAPALSETVRAPIV